MRLAFLVICIIFAACSLGPKKEAPQTSVKSKMQDAYTAAFDLYTYVWNPEEFQKDENSNHISSLLQKLINDFHRVQKVAPIEAYEPGFRVSLATHREMLSDIKSRFDEGSKSYAHWRLQGLTSNCIACHTRYNAPTDFVGNIPKQAEEDYAYQQARAQFLLATRQFSRAEKEFLSLATRASSSTEALDSLKLWLVVKVRVKSPNEQTAATLSNFIESQRLSDEDEEVVSSWIEDLKSEKLQRDAKRPLPKQAADLLSNINKSKTLVEDDKKLVSTLVASSYLHEALQKDLSKYEKKRASYLLALAYYHMPIAEFEIYKDLYLEQCIREFPFSKEAKEAYGLYSKLVESESSGSSGINLQEEDEQKLRQLRNLAYGSRELTVHDTLILDN